MKKNKMQPVGVAHTEPALSVIMLVGGQRERSVRGLRSVLEQNIVDQMEVLVVECSAPGTPPLAGSDHPSVRTLYFSPEMLDSEARAEGIRQARGPVVAFLQEHNVALPGWAQALLKAHEGPWAGVCGEILNGNPGVGISDAVVLINHASSLPPAQRGVSELIPGYNSAYKRQVLLQYGDRLDILMRCETVLQWRLGQDGYKLFVEPDAKIVHYYVTKLSPYLAGHYAWNRCFGHTRAEVFSWPIWKRALYVCSIPLSPWVRLARLFVFLARNHPRQIGPFFRNFPTMVIVQAYFAIGRGVGALFGLGDAAKRILQFEISEDRLEM